MKNKPYILYFLIISLFIFFLVDLTSDVADKLSGEFFPKDSPIWAVLYPNDLLPWGSIFFLIIGSVIGFFLLSKIKKNYVLSFITFLGLLPSLIIFPYLHDIYNSVKWVFLLTKLFNVWWFSLIMGFCLPLLFLNLLKQTNKDEKQNE